MIAFFTSGLLLTLAILLPPATLAETPASSCANVGEVFGTDALLREITIKGEKSGELEKVTFSPATFFTRVTADYQRIPQFDPKTIQVGDRLCAQANPDSILVLTRPDVQQQQRQLISKLKDESAFGEITAIHADAHSLEFTDGITASTLSWNEHTKFRRYPGGVQVNSDAASVLKVGDKIYAEGKHRANGAALNATDIYLGGVRGIVGLIEEINGQDASLTIKTFDANRRLTVHIRPDAVFLMSATVKSDPHDPHPISLSDLQKGDSILVLAQMNQNTSEAAGFIAVTSFGSFEAPQVQGQPR